VTVTGFREFQTEFQSDITSQSVAATL